MGRSKMAEEAGEKMRCTRRRSSRILALEEEKKKEGEQKERATKFNLLSRNETVPLVSEPNSKAGVTHSQHPEEGGHREQKQGRPPTVMQYDRRRVKLKRLEDVVVTPAAYPSQQEGENRKLENSSVQNVDHPAASSSVHQMPEKRVLEFVLDILQRKDTHNIFGQPVDGEEVDDYYTIIKKPMDFGTMRAKLQEGMYTSLEQFKNDVFLIFNNAMHFNSSKTLYYKEARSMQELAQRAFRALRTIPDNCESLFSLIRKLPGRKSQGEAEVTSARRARCGRVNTKAGRQLGLNTDVDQRENKVPSGSGDGLEKERRQTYRPCTSLPSENGALTSSIHKAYRPLAHIISDEFGYKESLTRFAKHLGPTAQKVANRKLARCMQMEAALRQSQTPNPLARTPEISKLSVPPLAQAPAYNYLDRVDNVPMPQVPTPLARTPEISKRSAPYLAQTPAYNLDRVDINVPRPQVLHHVLPGDLNVIKHASQGLDVQGDLWKGENHPTSYGFNSREWDCAYKGKMVCTDSRTDIDTTSLRNTVPPSDFMGISSIQQRENAHFNAIKDAKIASPGEMAANIPVNVGYDPKGKGKMICANDEMDLLHGSLGYDTARQNQNQLIGLGSHFALSGKETMNPPVASWITNMYKNMDTTTGARQPYNQSHPVPLADALYSKLLDMTYKRTSYSQASIWPSQPAKSSVHDTTFLTGLGSRNEVRANSAQAGQSLEPNLPASQQAIGDFPSVQMLLNKGSPLGPRTALQQVSQFQAAQKMAVLHAMSFYEKATPDKYQADGSAQRFVDNLRQSSTDPSQLDLALQL